MDYAPGWLGGHDTLLEHLVRTTTWHQPRREMYERMVDVPRLVASLPDDGTTADTLLEASDRAMYQVKRAGGNRVAAP